jgi:hypothetical protein
MFAFASHLTRASIKALAS